MNHNVFIEKKRKIRSFFRLANFYGPNTAEIEVAFLWASPFSTAFSGQGDLSGPF
jgi:hypothetical protein